MDLIVTYGGRAILQCKNATSIPRKGDILMISSSELKVINVVWHMENTTWVEIQVEY